MKNKHIIKCLVIGSILFNLLGCGSTPELIKKKNFSNMPPTVSGYRIGNITSDISQSTNFLGYVDKKTFNSILKQQLTYELDNAGLLHDENATSSDKQVATLNVFIDYSRHFLGDGTPFPSNIITAPRMTESISIILDGQEVFFEETRIKTLKNPSWIGLAYQTIASGDNKNQIQKDMMNLMAVSPDIVKYLIKITPNIYNENKKEVSEEERKLQINNIVNIERAFSKTKPNYKKYIPTSVADDYINKLSIAKEDDLQDIYEAIYYDRLMDSKLFDWIYENKVKQLFSSDENYDLSTLKWLMKSFSSTGNEKYLKLFERLAKEAKIEGVKDYAEDAISILKLRAYQAQFVHNSDIKDDSLTWKEHQLANMIRSQENNLQVEALKIIYRKKLYNEKLLDVVSNVLTTEGVKNTFRTWRNTDAYAWMCRILGSSDNIKYKTPLIEISKKSWSKKVRAYAEKFADKLS